MEGKSGVNLPLLAKVIGGWLVTLIVVGFTAAAFFAQGAFAPSIPNLRTVNRYERGLLEMSEILGNETGVSTTDFNVDIEEDKTDDSSELIAKVKELLDTYVNQCNQG